MCGCQDEGAVQYVKRGAKGVAKAVTALATGHDRTDAKTRRVRLSICKGGDESPPCDRYNPNRGSCEECGCLLGMKTLIASESCPLGKW